MKKITILIGIVIASLTSDAQWVDCSLINLSATGNSGNNYSFQVGSNVDSLVVAGLISSNV
tara:strand:- start:71 stop:253 length:183 start_codon:yes stop_codon:yes gene_type:complete